MKKTLACVLMSLCLLVRFSMAQAPATYALRGMLVMPDRLIPAGVILIRDGVIAAAGENVTIPVSVPVIDTHAIIAPGFIDLHNHLTWNVFPRWKPLEEFGNRYDWQQKAVYETTVSGPHAALAADGYECSMQRYAEVKAITEGETSVIGSLLEPCSAGLARNLDQPGSGSKLVDYNVFPLQMTEDQLHQVRGQLADGSAAAFLIHLAEGAPNDAAATREFTQLKGRGLLLPGVSLIHGVGLKPANFVEMAANHVGFVWSPRSNIELYGATADVAAARAAGVTIALAPDWSITGSDGTLGELNYAWLWNQMHGKLFSDADLVRMATLNAAALAGASSKLGSLEPGHLADLLILPPAAKHDAWWTLTHTTPAQVELVVIGGQPIYGEPKLLSQFAKRPAETILLCGVDKGLLLTGAPGHADAADRSWATTRAELESAMQQYGRKLAPLSECGN